MTVGETAQYHFDKVGVSAAIKTLLKSNGIDLNFNLKDVDVGGMGGLGGLISSSLPLLVLVTNDVVQDGNDFTIGLSLDKIYELLKMFVDLSALPEAVTKLLPKDMAIKAVLHTDGKILTGIDVVDSVMTTNDGAGDGTFNLTSRFNLFGAPAESLNVESMVPETLKALPARKILNVDTYGDIVFEKTEKADAAVEGATDTVITTRTISWKLAANLDIFKIMERNFILEDEIFDDNFFHFQLKLDGEPVLDLAFSPKTLNTNDLILGANVKVLLNTIMPDTEVLGMKLGELLGLFMGENYFIPMNTKALGYMISGQGGTVEAPLPVQSWENPAKYENLDAEASGEEGGFDIGSIVDIIGKVVSFGNGELELDVAELMKELKLDASITDIIGNLTGGGETARFTNTVFEFAKAETETYDVCAELQKGKFNEETQEYETRNLISAPLGNAGLPIDLEFETDEGFLKVYNMGEVSKSVSLDKSMRITLQELNAYVMNPVFKVRYTGRDLLGNEVHYGMTDSAQCIASIAGYIGLDPTKIGVQQTIEVVTGIPDSTGAITMLLGLIGMLGDGAELGIDVDAITGLLNSLKLGTFKADVILSEADYEVGLYNKTTGKEFGAEELPNIANAGDMSLYELRATTTYRKNAAYAEDSVVTSKFSGANNGNEWNYTSMIYQELCVDGEEFPFTFGLKPNLSIISQGDVEFPIYYKGMTFNKVYRFETPKETTYNFNANKDYFLLGSTLQYSKLRDSFKLKAIYEREDENLEVEYSLNYNPTWEQLEFVNVEELTDTKLSDIDTKNLNKLNLTFTKTGIAKFNVRIDGILMTTVEIPVLPKSENAVISDTVYSSVAGVASTKLNGKYSFDLIDTLPERYRNVYLDAVVTDMNGKKIPDIKVTVNGGENNVFELTEIGTQSVNFEITGLPQRTNQVSVKFTVRYCDASVPLVDGAILPQYNDFKAEAAFQTFPFGSAIPANSLTFTELNQPNVWKIAFAEGKYVLKRAGSDESIDLTVEMFSAEQTPVVLEDGIDEEGKIVRYGTLKVSFTYNDVNYEITRIFGGIVESGDFDTFAFGEAIPDGSFVVYAPALNYTYTFTLYGNIRSKNYYMQSNVPVYRISCNVAVYDAEGNAISGAVDTKTGKIVKYGLLKVSFTVDGVDYEFTRAFNGLEKSDAFDTFAFGEAVPDGSLTFTDAAKEKSYSLKFVDGAYAFFDGETAVGVTEAIVADANGIAIEGGIDADGKVVKSGTLKFTFTLDGTDYEIVREITEPETPVA